MKDRYVYICEKCGDQQTIIPRINVRCPLCGAKMHKTSRKW